MNNQFDSADYSQIVPDMDVAFENLMYDYFSEENSIKIKNDLLKKRMREISWRRLHLLAIGNLQRES